jgi:threonine dehydratase
MNFEMITAAANRIKGHARITPMLTSPFLDDIAGRQVLIKAECLQHTGSFKFRGAWSAVSALTDNTLKTGVIAYSSGNHAQGVAMAAAKHGAPAVIIMPADAPRMKIDNTRALGAEVILYDRENEDRDALGTQIASERGLTLIRPYDELGVTKADVMVCCGGGGLTSGIALALAETAPNMRVRPAEPQSFDDVTRSLVSGQIERNAMMGGSICDAIVTPQPGDLTFPILKDHCGPGVVVTDDECLRAMAHAFARLKIVVEPGGAAALAAALFHPDQFDGDAVIAVTTGGNVDPAQFARALEIL